MKPEIKKMLILNAPYLIFVYAFDKIGQAALKDGLYMKQAEVHGMSQRGGDVQSNLRISDRPIAVSYTHLPSR